MSWRHRRRWFGPVPPVLGSALALAALLRRLDADVHVPTAQLTRELTGVAYLDGERLRRVSEGRATEVIGYPASPPGT